MKKELSEYRKMRLSEYYIKYFNFFRLDCATQKILRGPVKDQKTFSYQAMFVKWFLVKKLELKIDDCKEVFRLWLARRDYKKILKDEDIEKLLKFNFEKNEVEKMNDYFSTPLYKKYLEDEFGFCAIINNDPKVSISQNIIDSTKKELSDISFRIYLSLLIEKTLTGKKYFSTEEILEITKISKSTFFRKKSEIKYFLEKNKNGLYSICDGGSRRFFINVYFFDAKKMKKFIEENDDDVIRLALRMMVLPSYRHNQTVEILLKTLSKWLRVNPKAIGTTVQKMKKNNIIDIKKKPTATGYDHNFYIFKENLL